MSTLNIADDSGESQHQSLSRRVSNPTIVQSGDNATATFGTFNNVRGNQTNINTGLSEEQGKLSILHAIYEIH